LPISRRKKPQGAGGKSRFPQRKLERRLFSKKNHTINREIATNDTKKIGSCVVSPKNLLGNFKLFLKILFHVGTVKITEILNLKTFFELF
jgi:hypothetical protein